MICLGGKLGGDEPRVALRLLLTTAMNRAFRGRASAATRLSYVLSLARLFTAVLFLGVLSPALASDPAREAAKIVANAKAKGSGSRLLEVVIAHPTEPVLFEAARWPWGEVTQGSAGVREFLRPWIARSPALRAHFLKVLRKGSPEARATAIGLLRSVVTTEPGLHEELFQLASKGDVAAVRALEPFVASHEADRRLILRIARRGPRGADRLLYTAALEAVAPHVDVPEVREFFLGELENTKDPEVLERLLRIVGVGAPEFLRIARELLKQPASDENLDLKEAIVSMILNRYPDDAEAMEALKNLLDTVTARLDRVPSRMFNTFKLAARYSERIPGMGKIIEEGTGRLIALLNRDNGKPTYDAMAATELFELYLEYSLARGAVDEARLKELADAFRGGEKRTILSDLVHRWDQLPKATQAMVAARSAEVDSNDLDRSIRTGAPVSRLAMQIAVRDLESSKETVVEDALSMLDRASALDPGALDRIRAMTRHPDPKKSALARNRMREIDPSDPVLLWPEGTDAPPEVKRQRRLLAAPDPVFGWRQVVQGYAVSYESDPFLFLRGADAAERAAIERGAVVRESALAEAGRAFEREGMTEHPVAWALRRFDERRELAARDGREGSLTRQQLVHIETEALNRVRAQHPNVKASDLGLWPYSKIYNRYVFELTLEARNNTKTPVEKTREMITEEWRANTIRLLQDQFRAGLRAILAGGHGRLVAMRPDSRSLISGEELQVRESDLESIRLLPPPAVSPYSVSVEMQGKHYQLIFVGRSLEGIESLAADRLADASEVAALTLGARQATREDIAREVYLSRVFRSWVKQFQEARFILQSESVARLAASLKKEAAVEESHLRLSLFPDGAQRPLVALLWQPIESDANHWRAREAQALSRGNVSWRIAVPDQDVSPRRSLLDWSGFGGRAAPEPPPAAVPPAVQKPLLRERSESRNKEITQAMKDDLLYRLEPLQGRGGVPERFVENYHRDFATSEATRKLQNVSSEASGVEFFLHTNHVNRVGESGFVPVPRPVAEGDRYRLATLQIYGSDGVLLYADRDYELFELKETGAWAARILNARVEAVRFSAGFAKEKTVAIVAPAPPRVSSDRVSELSLKLAEAGMIRLAAAIEALLSRKENKATVDVVSLGEAFQSSGRYATVRETDLGLRAGSVRADNPFFRFARFVDPQGYLCVQCDGANSLFAEFLRTVLPKESGIRVMTLPMLVRDAGEMALSRASLHLSTFLAIPGHELPLEIDVTSSSRAVPLAPTANKFFEWLTSRFRRSPPKQETKPAWLATVKDQVPEPPKEHAIQVRRDDSAAQKVKIERLREALIKTVTAKQKEGVVPSDLAWDRTEPLARVFFLAQTALKALHPETDLTVLRQELPRKDSGFAGRPLETKAEILAAVGELAALERGRMEKHAKSGVRDRFVYYRNPLLTDSLQLLFAGLEELKVSPRAAACKAAL